MTTNFEQTTRPFATRDVRPGKPAPSADAAAPVENIVLRFGLNGAGRTFNGSTSFNATTYQDKTPREALGARTVNFVEFPRINFVNGQLQI